MKIGAGRQLSRCTPGTKLTAIEREGYWRSWILRGPDFYEPDGTFLFSTGACVRGMLSALAGYHDHHSLAACMGEGRVFFACRAA